MNEIHDIYVEYPFFGYRRIHAKLLTMGYKHNQKKTKRIMQLMGLQAIYPKKKTTVLAKGSFIHPYLLRDLKIVRANQVWQVDITYIKIRGGFIYLVCLIDVYSRKIMGWRLSQFLDTRSCIEALNKALAQGIPEIINSDQGCQFTSEEWQTMVRKVESKISMDGKGRWADNVYIERFWRSLKYEIVYMYSFDTIAQAHVAIEKYIKFYNEQRPHQSLNYKVPDYVYCTSLNELNLVAGQELATLESRATSIYFEGQNMRH
jgi:putative transposase